MLHGRARWLALIPVLILLVALTAREYERGGILTSDTIELLDGVAATDSCLHAGELRCDRGVGRWPLLQYLPALALKRLGRSRLDVGNDLVFLNWVAVLGTLALLWQVGRRLGPAIGPLLVLAGLVSPLLWYGAAGFGEALAAFATTGLVVAVLLGWSPWAVGGFIWMAAVSKETALPVLLVLATLALLVRVDYRRPSRADLAPIAIGGSIGLLSVAAFNLFRFGVPWNEYYLNGDWQVHELTMRADFAAAGLIAPNSGMVWFWPVASGLLVLCAVAVARRRSEGRWDPAMAVVGGVFLTTVALLVAFAGWWSPFGWEAFGDRLIVPWVPALVVVAVAAAAPRLNSLIPALANSLRVIAATWAMTAVFGLAMLAAFLSPLTPLGLFHTTGFCANIPNLFERIAAGDPEVHRIHARCISKGAWEHPPVLPHLYDELQRSRIAWAVLWALATAGLLLTAARSARGEPVAIEPITR